MENSVKTHFMKTKELIKKIKPEAVAGWLLNKGYLPEHYVLPPSFSVKDFKLQPKPYFENLNNLESKKLVNIGFPKTLLTSRVFGIQHPHYFHDIVFHLIEDWNLVINHLFHDELKIYSYSFPIPVDANSEGRLGCLRSGRMIYQWISMAEKDIVAEAYQYSFLVRADITNFYNSVNTHSIGWALHGKDEAFNDKECNLTGNKIDKLVQFANETRTNGIPVGSALSDLIAEIILTRVDRNISVKLKDINFIGSRFKDDYRILCNSEEDAKKILKVLSEELVNYNLLINESKTKILRLPEGLYREHDREYHKFSLREMEKIPFKTFEFTLLKALDIHKEYPGTSILEKFLSELFNKERKLKIVFSEKHTAKIKEIFKLFSLLIMVKRKSEKTLCHILAIFERVYNNNKDQDPDPDVKIRLENIIKSETKKAIDKKSVFEVVWLIFFSRYMSFDNITSGDIEDDNLKENEFLKTILSDEQRFFTDSKISFYKKPENCKDITLSKHIAVFDRSN